MSAVDGRLTVVNFTLSGEIQDVDTGLTALGDSVAALEGRMENEQGELTSIEEHINELDFRLMKLEVVGILVLKTSNHHNCYSIDIVNSILHIPIRVCNICMYLLHVYLYRKSCV